MTINEWLHFCVSDNLIPVGLVVRRSLIHQSRDPITSKNMKETETKIRYYETCCSLLFYFIGSHKHINDQKGDDPMWRQLFEPSLIEG